MIISYIIFIAFFFFWSVLNATPIPWKATMESLQQTKVIWKIKEKGEKACFVYCEAENFLMGDAADNGFLLGDSALHYGKPSSAN